MFSFIPKDQKFYDQLEALGGLVVSAGADLRQLMQDFPEAAEDRAAALDKKESQAAGLAQSTLERLDAAFITPLDREDILHLITDMHRVVKAISALGQRIVLYGLDKVDPQLTRQADILAQMADCLHELLRRLRKDHRLSNLNGQLKDLNELERSAGRTQRQFLSELYRGRPDPLEVMKKKELHDLLVEAVARSENVTRTLERVVLKNE